MRCRSESCFNISLFHLGTRLTPKSPILPQELISDTWFISADNDINSVCFSFQQGLLEHQNPFRLKGLGIFFNNLFKLQTIIKCLHISGLKLLPRTPKILPTSPQPICKHAIYFFSYGLFLKIYIF